MVVAKNVAGRRARTIIDHRALVCGCFQDARFEGGEGPVLTPNGLLVSRLGGDDSDLFTIYGEDGGRGREARCGVRSDGRDAEGRGKGEGKTSEGDGQSTQDREGAGRGDDTMSLSRGRKDGGGEE